MESSEPVSDPGCPNCGYPDPGRFCPSCGQEQGELVPSVASWARDAAADLFEVDGKLPRSLKALFWPPGWLTVEWRQGRRASYVRPFRLYLGSALIFFLAWPSTPLQWALEDFTADVLAVEVQPQSSSVEAEVEVGTRVIIEGLPGLLLILFVPFVAVVLRLASGGVGGYVEHLVMALHLHTATFIVVTLTVPLSLLPASEIQEFQEWSFIFLLIALFGFSAATVGRVYGIGAWRALGRTMFVALIYVFVIAFTVAALLGIVLSSA